MRTVPFTDDIIRKMKKKNGYLGWKMDRGVQPGDNFLSVTRSIVVELKGNKKISYFYKGIPLSRVHQDFCIRSNFFYRELFFYQTILKEFKKLMSAVSMNTKLPFPIFQRGKATDYSKGSLTDPTDFLLMIDMKKEKGFLSPERWHSLDVPHCVLVLRSLANFHALSHAYKQQKNISSLNDLFPIINKNVFWGKYEFNTIGPVLQLNFKNLLHSIECHKGQNSQLFKSVKNFMDCYQDPWDLVTKLCGQITDKDAAALHKNPNRFENPEGYSKDEIPPWAVLCIGDCKQANTMFKYNGKNKDNPKDVILLDFQIYLEASPLVDLVYFIYNCTEKETRREGIFQLLNIYVEAFNEFCSKLGVKTMEGFGIDLLTKRFELYKLLGFLFAVLILPQNHCDKEKIVDFEQLHNQSLRPEEIIEKCSPKSFNDDNYLSHRLFDIVEEMVADEVI